MVTEGSERSLADALDERISAERVKGRKPTLSPEQDLELVKEYLQSPQSLREIARARGLTLGVCRRAIRRVRDTVGTSELGEILKGESK